MDASGESKCRYDIFLNFRGEDTRDAFIGSLYDALRRKGLNPFLDDEGLKIGDQLSGSLLKAIEESRISIVVLSENYASSSWCLDELVKILETMKMKNQLVWPIFYKVEPSDVRKQTNGFGQAMAKLEQRFEKDPEKMNKWRSALFEVANLKGWTFKTGYEYQFIQEILKKATAVLYREQLDVGEHVIGHQSRIEEVKSLLDIESGDKVCMVGIHGTGGIGKTTLAKALYNLISDRFECAVFLDCARARSNRDFDLMDLQERLLYKLSGGENIKLCSVAEGVNEIKDRFRCKRVLLVLDDIDNKDQLKKLAVGECSCFGSGSRIIITTRDQRLLILQGVEKRYEMELLNDDEALQLFCWNAFKMGQLAPDYEDISTRVVRYAKGLPLALKVIGSHLFGYNVLQCESAMDQYEQNLNGEILGILKISYDSLEETAKRIFLDIACFFKRGCVEYVQKVLDKCNLSATYNIEVLVQRSLLTIEHGCLSIHDLIQHMGKEVVKVEAPNKRTRLFCHEDVLSVSKNSESNIEGIILDPPELKEVDWDGSAFVKMDNLQILIVRNTRFSCKPVYLPNSLRLLEWKGYPKEYLPNIPKSIVVLNLSDSDLKLGKAPLPAFEHLTYLNFSRCQFITHIPDVSKVPNLRLLKFDSCENLISVHRTVGFLKGLVVLSASYCKKLKTFLPKMSLPSLESLELRGASIEDFPDIEGVMDKLLVVDLSCTRIKALPPSVSNLTGLQELQADECESLTDVPSDLFLLPNIQMLFLSGTSANIRESYEKFRKRDVAATGQSRQTNLSLLNFARSGLTDEDLRVILEWCPGLEHLHVSGNNFESLPAEITESAYLGSLDVTGCSKLEKIPELPSSIWEVKAAGCPSLTPETCEMLWSQACKEDRISRVQMPLTEIPGWFRHRWKGDTVSFWVRQEVPKVTFASIFISNRPVTLSHGGIAKVELYVNGVHVPGVGVFEPLFDEGDQVLLFHLNDWVWQHRLPDALRGSEWKHVEVKFGMESVCSCCMPLTVSECGAYVYDQETNMEDIQFECPKSLERTASLRQEEPNKRIRVGGKRKRKSRRTSNTAQCQTSSVWGQKKRKIEFPMSTKSFWIFLSRGFTLKKKRLQKSSLVPQESM